MKDESRPTRPGASDRAGRISAPRSTAIDLVGCLAAVLVTALAARLDIEVPGTPVPLSAQTLAVLGSGIALGARWGATAMSSYLAAGAVGLPVFADGAAGAAHLLGPTAGYLVGFVAAAFVAGRWVERGRARSFWRAVPGMLLAHATILFLGWARLAIDLGPGAAYRGGVEPFLLGAVAKAGLATALALGVSRFRLGSRLRTDSPR